MNPHFSVVIPAYNEEVLLPRLLEAISNQTFKDFEVILVDANSTDKTIEVAKKFSNKFTLKIVEINEKNVSASRNLGASKAKGEFLFFIDADNYVYPAFLKDMIAILETGYQMVIPSIIPDSKNLYYKIAYKTANIIIWLTWKFKLSFSTGGNLVVKRHVFEEIHGFDKTIFVGEDHDIVIRARKNGYKIGFFNNPKVIFSVRRLKKEGGVMLFKYFISTIYIMLFGKMTRKIYNYEMGGEYYRKKEKPKKI